MKKTLGVAIFLTALAGCKFDNNGANEDAATDASAKTSSTYAVVIGIENSKFAGACPGAKLDSDRMYALLSKCTAKSVLLQDKDATRYNVKKAIEKGIADAGSGLFILYYSGHGGSDPFPDTGIEETDGKDEYLCLYDNYFRDNEIWELISKSKGRILVCVDACHSRTMFRQANVTLQRGMPLRATWQEQGPISMQCWSGCPDDTYSYGSSTGGQFTNTLLRHYKENMTYNELWGKIEADNNLKRYETVQRTLMGADFGNLTVFR